MNIKLGEKEYEFALTNGALYNFGKDSGEDYRTVISQAQKNTRIRADLIIDFVYHGCKKENKNFPFTKEEVIDFFDLSWEAIVFNELIISIIGMEEFEKIKANPEEVVEKKEVESPKK